MSTPDTLAYALATARESRLLFESRTSPEHKAERHPPCPFPNRPHYCGLPGCNQLGEARDDA